MVSITNGSETFTFAEGMISKITSKLNVDLDQNILPQSGPLNNIGIDNNGVTKVITITGNLFDSVSASVSNTQNIRDKEVMKLWLEAILNGLQSTKIFVSNYEYSSVVGSGSSTITDGISSQLITLPATFAVTTTYATSITFDEEAANPDLIPFTIDLWVAGS